MSRALHLLPILVVCLAASSVSAAPQKPGGTWLAASMQAADQTASRLAQTKKTAMAIRPGMTRAQVAKIFLKQDGGLVSSDLTRYYVGDGVMVNVPFDEHGGPWSPENQVCGPLKVYRSLFHTD